jgi:flavin-dependent dehydrogenase
MLARVGARVRLLDRATFPREKLCGDTINPGTLALLGRLKMADAIEARGLRVDGMIVTGESGVAIEGRYPNDLHGRALGRSELDWTLVTEAIRAGAAFEPGCFVRGAVVRELRGQLTLEGVTVGSQGKASSLLAPVTIAADGRRSRLAFELGLASHPARPRRWAIGAYFEQMGPASSLGEMHVRCGRYIGVASVAGGRTNVCLVKPSRPGDAELRDPAALLARELERDSLLRDRFRGARLLAPPVVLGPLAVELASRSIDGLILAGDAAGFVDPMTGDGLRFAVSGGELAAQAALAALEHGWNGVHAELKRRRRAEFGAKWRFNRALRALVASPLALKSTEASARLAPGLIRRIIARAGDCDLA